MRVLILALQFYYRLVGGKKNIFSPLFRGNYEGTKSREL